MLRVYVLVEPARRHRCEVCNEIFECHLCGILETHHAHNMNAVENGKIGKFFVCEECCADPVNRYQMRDKEMMDMLTGRHV